MREVPDSHDGDGRARVKELELREHIPGQVDPRDESGDHGCIEPYQPDALLQAVARLHHDRPVDRGRIEHVPQLRRSEVAVDRCHRLRVDPVLGIKGAVPHVDVGVDAGAHSRYHTSSMGCQSAPGSRSSPILTWHGSVCVHHS